jgi:hypothetical protein
MTTKFTNGAGTVPDIPSRRVVASFATYTEAERAVDLLADSKFPVERTAIVGHGLKLVEQVTGRMDYGKAALRGGLSGAFVGVLIGWLFGAFNWFDPVVASGWLVLDGLWFGAVVGALVGLLIHALSGGRRDFESFGSLRAERYDVVVDEEVADEAARLLAGGSEQPAQAEQPAQPQAEQQPAQADRVGPGARGGHQNV